MRVLFLSVLDNTLLSQNIYDTVITHESIV